MADIFLLLAKVALFLFIIGLLRPKYVLFWSTMQNRTRVIIIFLPLIVALFIISSMLPEPEPQKATGGSEMSMTGGMEQNIVTLDSLMPADEKQFIDLINHYAELYKKAPNAVERSKVWSEREEKINSLDPGLKMVTNWVGIIKQVGTTEKGAAAVVIGVSNRITMKTSTNDLADAQLNTLILPETPLYESLSRLGKGSNVIFSAELVKSADTNESQGMMTPTYIMKFSEIKFAQ